LALKKYYVIVLQTMNDHKIDSNQKGSTALHQALITDSSDFDQDLETRSKEILRDLERLVNTEKQKNVNLDINHLILIGRGHGGDIMMKFASLYPKMVSKAMSLDSKKYPFPRNPTLEILRFGAIDDEPDEGVVPESGVEVLDVKGARHIDLCDRGSQKIKDEIFM
jgi:predicted esterase